MSMLLRDGVVSDIGSRHALGAVPVINARGGSVVPALWDHHVHLRAATVTGGVIRSEKGKPMCSPARTAAGGASADGRRNSLLGKELGGVVGGQFAQLFVRLCDYFPESGFSCRTEPVVDI